ncbi:MAG: hypothetical protein GY795_01140 [Desulfobacterales bacterium]|nr:hypothetical protein [Desulfobacterales bacterium]
MDKKRVIKPENAVERNIAMTGEIMRYLMNQPHLFDSLPENFELVILPDNDPEMRLYNLELLDVYGGEGKSVVFARVKTEKQNISDDSVDVYVPIAA